MNELRDNADVGELIQYIVIKIDDEQYGINIKFIDNIVRMQQITRVPQVDEYLKGVINIRGEVVPVMSLRLKMGLEADVSSKEEEDHSLYMEVTGEDMGVIIGKRGQTLDALQYLLNRVAQCHQDGSVRIKLDTEDYRERRKKTLENLARNIASKAKKTNRSVVLEPMNPYERMIIHSTLQQDPAVTTYSKGKEPYRTVVVALKK